MVTPRTFILLVLDGLGVAVEGKTKLQKLGYFAGLLTGKIGELGYQPHYYGPYSAVVDGALGELRALGFLRIDHVRTGRLDGRGFEFVRYDYTLTDAGKELAREKKHRLPTTWGLVEQAVERLKSAGDVDYMALSYAAKSHFLLHERGGKATVSEIAELAPEFGWDLAPESTAAGIRLLRSLDLVTEDDRR